MTHTSAVSDPEDDGDDRAWNSDSGYENGDMCAYVYGPTQRDEKGSVYNYVSATGKKYLVQMNWSPVQQQCVQSV